MANARQVRGANPHRDALRVIHRHNSMSIHDGAEGFRTQRRYFIKPACRRALAHICFRFRASPQNPVFFERHALGHAAASRSRYTHLLLSAPSGLCPNARNTFGTGLDALVRDGRRGRGALSPSVSRLRVTSGDDDTGHSRQRLLTAPGTAQSSS
jgi:hypothetical protein